MNLYIKNSSRSKNIRLAVYYDGRVVVTKPKRVSQHYVHAFIAEKMPWIERKLKEASILPKKEMLKGTQADYEKYKEKAKEQVNSRLLYFNQYYGFTWNTISIKNTSSRWGSCSSKGNLHFSYKLALIPSSLSDYVIVHELCHLQEQNHSERFWKLVTRTMPNYKELRTQLKEVI